MAKREKSAEYKRRQNKRRDKNRRKIITGLLTGQLVRWGSQRAFGFILCEGKEVFAHKDEFGDIEKLGEPMVGDLVRFRVMLDRHHLRAVRISRVIGEAA